MSGFAAPLLIADHRQQRTQPLVVGDRALVDLSDLVEDAVGQLDTPIADRQPAVGVVDDAYALADRRLGLPAGSRMKSTLSYCRVSACERVRSSFQANASSRSSPARNGRCKSLLLAGGLAKRQLSSAMTPGSRALPCARVAAPASRNSLTNRSCRVLCSRSTRPLAGLELAQMMSMLSACKARPNWVIPSPPSAPGWLTRKTPCLSL